MNQNHIPLPSAAAGDDVEVLRRHYLNLRALSLIAATPDQGGGRLAAALELGARHLGLDLAIISRIDADRYTVQHHWAREPGLEDGAAFELGQTYCAITLKADDVVAISHMDQSPHRGHPCYEAFNLETYIGAPIMVDGARYGTVNFSSAQPYSRQFDDGDIEFMRLLAHWVAGEILRLRRERDLLRSNQELEAFAYAVSHDLRQPLRVAASYLTLLERGLSEALTEDLRQYLNFARDGAQTMTRKINALLDYSRMGRSEAADMTALDAALDGALASLKLLLDENQAEIRRTSPLPEIRGHAVELEHLLQNLIENAVKYRSPDRNPVIEIGAEKQGPLWRITVADNCAGIQAEQIETVFGLFKRGCAIGDGIGIGLALCRKIARAHGGDLTAQSKPGQGSTFILTLPAV